VSSPFTLSSYLSPPSATLPTSAFQSVEPTIDAYYDGKVTCSSIASDDMIMKDTHEHNSTVIPIISGIGTKRQSSEDIEGLHKTVLDTIRLSHLSAEQPTQLHEKSQEHRCRYENGATSNAGLRR